MCWTYCLEIRCNFLFLTFLQPFLHPTQLLSSCFLLQFFALAFCEISSSSSLSKSEFSLEKSWKFGTSYILKKNLPTSNVNYKATKWAMVQTHPKKISLTLTLKWYPRYLIGRAKAFDTSAANHNQSGNCIFSPCISHLACKKACFIEGRFSSKVSDSVVPQNFDDYRHL